MVFLGQTLPSVKQIQQYIYTKETLVIDCVRFNAYYNSNIGLTAYEKENYSLAKQRFTEALAIYQRVPGSVINITLVRKYLEKIDEKLQPPFEKRMYFILVLHALHIQQIPIFI